MTITHNEFYDMFHIGSIIRNKDILSQEHNINIKITNNKHGGSNGRTYQMITFIGTNININQSKKDIIVIERQAELDYQERKSRKTKFRMKMKYCK